MLDVQNVVYESVVARGYRDGWSSEEFVMRQFLKSGEELGECFCYLFDGQLPPADEIADVVIPMLTAAAEMGVDLGEEVLDKVLRDIERGVREHKKG